jgi:hypothetical protein
MLVNKYAGRSYLDPANYPVFPWIIDNYSSKEYGYRDMNKSVGALVIIILFRVMSKELSSLEKKYLYQILLNPCLLISLEPTIVRLG